MADSSKSVLAHPGMRTFARGIVPVVEEHFSMLLTHCESNEELLKSGCFESMYYHVYGPFTLEGNIELEIRLYPVGGGTVQVHVCLLSNAEYVKNFCHTLVYYNSSSTKWVKSNPGGTEKEFKAESGSIGEGLGLSMVYLDWFSLNYAQDDHILFELALWLILDDSCRMPVPTEPQL